MSAGEYSAGVHSDGPNKQVFESGSTLEIKAGATVSRSVKKVLNSGWRVGAGAGWTIASNTGAALLPAGVSAGTLVVPVTGLKLGDIVTGFKVNAQIESAGNTATLDADLRKLTNVAADPTDASVGAITQVSVIADTAVAAEKTGLSETLQTGEALYILITGTTAASTDVQLLNVEVYVDEK